MRVNYHLGQDANEIYLEVQIGTPGLAHSTAYLFSDETTYEKIAESGDEDGNIEECIIGLADALAGKFLMIRTSVDLRLMDPGQWPQLIENIYCEYVLSGGTIDKAYYCEADDKHVSTNGSVVVIEKIFDLIREEQS